MRQQLTFLLFLVLGGCAAEAVRTPDEAKAIALSSACARRIPNLAPHETTPTEWQAERRGNRWYAWLPFGPGAQYPGITRYGHMGAWVSAKDGKIIACEAGASHAIGQVAPPVLLSSPPVPGSRP